MNCPLETPETADLLLAYCSRKLSPESTSILEKHLELCPSCRSFAEGQRAVWNALDSWDAAPVSADFDSRLYRRIETEVTWRERLARTFRPLLAYHGLPAAAAACLVLMAGLLLEHSGKPAGTPVQPDTAAVEVQPEKVEQALDVMEVLSEFNRKSRPENAGSKL
jgi:anti-sigma factor RsiW